MEKEARRNKSKALSEVIESLSAEERLMVALRFVDGRSVKEVAGAIGHTEKNTYRKLAALMDKCRTMLKGKGVGPEDLK